MKTSRPIPPFGKLAAAVFCAVCGLLLAKSLPGDLRQEESTNLIAESNYSAQDVYLTGDGRRVEPTAVKANVGHTEMPLETLERKFAVLQPSPKPAEFGDLSDGETESIAAAVATKTADAPKSSIMGVSWNPVAREEWNNEIRLPIGFQPKTEFTVAAAPRWDERGDAELEVPQEKNGALDFEASTLGSDVVSLELNQWKTTKQFFSETTKRVEIQMERRSKVASQDASGASGVVMPKLRIGSFIATGSFEAGTSIAPNSANRY